MKTHTATELIEASLSEGVITHSSGIDKISSILDTNAFHSNRVSFSKYPQYSHYGHGTFLAFDKEKLEDHNNSIFKKPVYYDRAPAGAHKHGGKKFSTNTDSKEARDFFDIGGKLRLWNAPTDLHHTSAFYKFRASGRVDEPFQYKPEREVTAVKGVKFKKEHIRYLGYHAVLFPYTREAGPVDDRPDSDFIEHENKIKQVKALAAKHNLPFRLSVQLNSVHHKYDDFMATGRSNHINNFLTHLRDRGHSDLASKAVVGFGTKEDTPNLSKRTHPSLKSNLTAESMIEGKLGSRDNCYSGWIDPAKNYHELEVGQNHRGWSESNSEHVNSFGKVHVGFPEHPTMTMLKSGWVRKSAPDAYEFHEKKLGSVLSHVKRFHPEVALIHMDMHNDKGYLKSSERIVR